MAEDINKYLDQILDSPSIWTERQVKVYQILKTKVSKFQSKEPEFFLNQDKEPIMLNIQEQSWFEESRNKSIIRALFDEMIIKEYQTDQTTANFLITFYKSKFNLIMSYQKGKFYYYLETLDGAQRAYFTYYDTHGSQKQQESLRLPEFDKIYSISKLKLTEINKRELLKFFSEILVFYDELGISDCHIGIKYPISMGYFANSL